MLINEIITKEAEPAYDFRKRIGKSRADIPDRKTIKVGEEMFIWSKVNDQWYNYNKRRFVPKFSELDKDLVDTAVDRPKKQISFNPLKLVGKGISKVAGKVGMGDIAGATRRDSKAGMGQKTGAFIGGAIGRGIDKLAGLGRYKGRYKQQELPNMPSFPIMAKGDTVYYKLKNGQFRKYPIENVLQDEQGQEEYFVKSTAGSVFQLNKDQVVSFKRSNGEYNVVNPTLHDQLIDSLENPKSKKTTSSTPKRKTTQGKKQSYPKSAA